MGVSTIIYDPSLFGFPDFPTTNLTVFSNPTAGTNFTVPAGVQWIGVKLWGGGGGSGIGLNSGNGGNGSYAQIIMEVTPGEILQVRVGGGGQETSFNDFSRGFGGVNGGGNAGIGSDGRRFGGGGGGYSGIFTNLRPLVMVGGGGGGRSGGFQPGGSNNGIRASINSFIGGNGANDNSNRCGGGGGGGFKSGSGGGAGDPSGNGGSGLGCAILRDHQPNQIARRIRPIFIASNGFENFGTGGTGVNAGLNGRVEITY